MESQPQNPEFRNDPESFHPCNIGDYLTFYKPLKLWIVLFLVAKLQI